MSIAGTGTTEAEAQVVALRRIGSVLADGVPSPLLVCDAAGTVLLANAALDDFLGRSRKDVLGRRLVETDVFDSRTVQSWFVRLEQSSEPWTEEVRSRGRGPSFMARVHLEPLRWAEEPAFALAVSIETDDPAASRFAYRFSDVSGAWSRRAFELAHDLRNPLSGISTAIQYVAKTLKEDERFREMLDLVLSDIKRMDGMIANMACMPTEATSVAEYSDVCAMLEEALSAHRDLMERKRLTVSVAVEPFPAAWTGDREQVTRAFSAIVGAVADACTERGAFRVHAGMRFVPRSVGERGRGAECLVVEIDGASKIPDARAFVEALDPACPPSEERVGLYLAAQIIETHGGLVELSGAPGRRVRFSVVLPARTVRGGQA